MPEIRIVWKSVSWLLGPRFGKYVKVVSDAPGEFLAGLDAHIDIGFGTDGGANGPEDQFRQRPVGGLADAGVRHGVLYADVVVLRRVAVTFQRGVYRLAFLQLLEVSQLSAAGFGEPFEIGRGAHREGELDGELGPGPDISSLGTQAKTAYIQYERLPDALSKNIYLTALHDRNEVLFYRLFSEHLREMIPIVSDLTVGLAMEQYHHECRRPRGVYLSIDHAGPPPKPPATKAARDDPLT